MKLLKQTMDFLKQTWVTPVLLIAILIAVFINIAITADISEENDKGSDAMHKQGHEGKEHSWWFFNDKEEKDVEDNATIASDDKEETDEKDSADLESDDKEETDAEGNAAIERYNPVINPDNFVDNIDNQYYSLVPGTKFTNKGTKGEELQTNEVIVTDKTKTIIGVKTIVVNDRVLDTDGNLVEETFDWYGQDKEGNVWYFGEDSKEYENGKVISTEGSWEAGKNGALPGIIMKSNPKLGETWKQEYLKGVAEDMAQILSLNESVTVISGSYKNCIKTKDWSALFPDVLENKYYCPDAGVVLAESVQGEEEHMELSKIN